MKSRHSVEAPSYGGAWTTTQSLEVLRPVSREFKKPASHKPAHNFLIRYRSDDESTTKSVHRNAAIDFKQISKTWYDDNDLEFRVKRAYSISVTGWEWRRPFVRGCWIATAADVQHAPSGHVQ